MGNELSSEGVGMSEALPLQSQGLRALVKADVETGYCLNNPRNSDIYLFWYVFPTILEDSVRSRRL